MYKGIAKLVSIPQTTNSYKIVCAGSGYIYYQSSYTWNAEKRQPEYGRKCIGRRDEKKEGLMYPNKNYENIFGAVDPEVSELRKRFCATELKEAGKFDCRMAFGQYFVVVSALKSAGAYDPLMRTFPKSYTLIIGLVVHAIDAKSTTSQSFPSWCFDHYCGMDRVVSDSEISKLYKKLGKDQGSIDVFFTLFAKSYGKIFPSKKRIVGFDSTNENSSSNGIDLAKRGHAKLNVGLPDVNTAMFVDEETGIPLWYEHFDGSVLDKSQTPYSMKKIVDLGYKKLFAMFDRGYYSEEDISALDQLKDIEYGVLCPDGTDWVDEMFRKYGAKIKDQQNYYIPEENVYGVRHTVSLFEKKYFAYLFYDSDRAEEERQTIHEVMSFFWEEASSRVRYTDKMRDHYAKRAIIVTKVEKDPLTGKNYSLAEDTEIIQELLDRTGLFVMLSPIRLEPSEAIRIVRKRDRSEKAFQFLMEHFHLRTTYRHSSNTFRGLMFMAFIADIALTSISYFESEKLRACTAETIPRIIQELNKYKIERNSDGTWRPGFAMNKDQKAILAKLGVSEDDAHNAIEEVSV